jgi:GDP-mannose transporter
MDSASAPASIFAYCLASISLTLANKFIVSGHGFTLFFLLLTVQSLVSVALVLVLRQVRVLHFRHFSLQDARAWAPISLLLAAVIYTGSKSLQWLTIPVYTIFKNLAIIVIVRVFHTLQ